MTEEVLYLYDVCKKSGSHPVLNHIALNAIKGEILAILGNNDSSLETLAEILCGAVRPDSGTMWYDNRFVRFDNILEAREMGIFMIRRESTLFREMTVAENITGFRPFSLSELVIHAKEERDIADRFLREHGFPLRPETPVYALSDAEKCILEMARAVYRHAKLVVFYRVGSGFSPEELELYRTWQQYLKSIGITVICMDTSVETLMTGTDRMLIISSGHIAGSLDRTEYDSIRIQRMLTKLPLVPESSFLQKSTAQKQEELRFGTRLLQLTDGTSVSDLSVYRGEIVGVFGDNAKLELFFDSLCGRHPMKGMICLYDDIIDAGKWENPSDYDVGCIRQLPGTYNVFEHLSLSENLLLPSYRKYSRFGLLNWRILRFIGGEISSEYDLAPEESLRGTPDENNSLRTKLPLLSWMASKPKVLIIYMLFENADEIERVRFAELLRKCREQGIAVLYCLNRNRESLAVCDRVIELEA